MKLIEHSTYCIIFLLLFSSCAIQVPPAGGDQDINEPKVIKSTPENYAINFKENEFEITFDEYVQLKDIQSQLVVSPPLKFFPEVKVRKKTLHVLFEDTLEENTTYSFNFGNSIIDNNEGNAIQNYQFVFSTGGIIDSLEISGSVKNASDDKPEKDVLVMLYKAKDDSLPFLKRPYYFGKTDVEGKYHVRNISPGEYKIIALADINKDYLYNPPEESIAFQDSLVIAGSSDISLRLFKGAEKFKLLRTYSEEPGKAVCVFNGLADTLNLVWISDTASLKIYDLGFSEKKDSLLIYYQNLDSDTIQLLFPQLSDKDTVIIRLLKKDSRGSGRAGQSLQIIPQASSGNYQDLHRPFDLLFNHPIDRATISGIRFLEDSVEVPTDKFLFTDSLHTRLRYSGTWKPGVGYNLLVPSGTFKDIYGFENDTIITQFRTRQETDYASLTAAISSVSQKFPVIVQLVDEKEKVYEETFVTNDSTIVFSFLSPGMYRLKIIRDINKNGLWDSGVYLDRKQPEPVFYYPDLIQMRANWDVEIKWQIP